MGDTGSSAVADAFALEGDAGLEEEVMERAPTGSGTVNHIDRSDLGLTLDKVTANFRQAAGKTLSNFVLGVMG